MVFCPGTQVGSAPIPPQRPPDIYAEHALHLGNAGAEEEAPAEEGICLRSAAGVLAQLAIRQPDVDHSGVDCLGLGKGTQGDGNLKDSADMGEKTHNQKRIVYFIDGTYPPEQIVRQNKEREAREEKLADERLKKKKIKGLRRKKNFDQ